MSCLVRSFVAVEVPAQVRGQVWASLEGVKRWLPGVRWARPDQMHVTLAFLGDVDSPFLAAAVAVLTDELVGRNAFDVRLHGLGAFPNARRARVVWGGIDVGKPDIACLQRMVVAALARVGYAPEARPFSPHLTLGRLREPADVSMLDGVTLSSDAFHVKRIVLFSSVLQPSGPTYRVLREFPLA